LAEGLNVLEGDNAQGKTNLLEAVYVLINGKSFRAPDLAATVQWGQAQAQLEARIRHEGLDTVLQTQLSEAGRETRLQGKAMRSLAEIHRRIRALVFTPDSSALFRGSPGLRRRYLDHAAGVHRPGYSGKLSRYLRLLKQRNELLELGRPSASWEEYNEAFAQAALELMEERAAYLEELQPRWRERLAQMMGSAHPLDARWEGPLWTPLALELKTVQGELERRRETEFRARRTLVGPHRDDFCLRLGEKRVSESASQGQQRMAVIALKLAEADLFQSATGRSPVFLLDDLGSELDAAHLGALLEILARIQAQTILTTAQSGAFDPLKARTLKVLSGRLLPPA